LIHAKLTDRLSDTPGAWDLMQCDSTECSLIWIDPMPTAETLEVAYSKYYTHVGLAQPNLLRRIYNRCRVGYLVSRFGYTRTLANPLEKIIGWMMAVMPHRRAALDASILWLPWIPDGKVLEIGCGNGDRLALLKSLGWQTQGIESDPKSAQIALARGLEIINQPFSSGLATEQSLDAILLCHVIEHLPDPIKVVRECHRLLKSGGILIMLTPNTQSLGYRHFGRNWLHLDPPRHLNLFNANNMCRMLENAGFDKPRCSTTFRDANWTLGGSLALKKRNTYQIGKLPFIERFLGLAMLYAEWITMKISSEAGEDLLCVAYKNQ
jgi:2-polyprenyl-3-methyl-5-hydroxy-6-metoxy-1,4-benzoquinol methylase